MTRKIKVEEYYKVAASDAAAAAYPECQRLAAAAGIVLIQHTNVHYTAVLKNGARLDIYPTNGRLYSPSRDNPSLPKPPYLGLAPNWTLLDVVNKLIGMVQL